MSIDEIKNLNIKERLILIDTIWETLESESNQVESPKWHKKLLEPRIEKIKNGQAEFISIDDLRKIWILKILYL